MLPNHLTPFGLTAEEIAEAYERSKRRPPDMTRAQAFAILLEAMASVREDQQSFRMLPLVRAFVRLREGSEKAIEILRETVDIIETETHYDASRVRRSLEEISRLCGGAGGEN